MKEWNIMKDIEIIDENNVAKRTRAIKYRGDTKCYICGSSETHIRPNGKLDWYRYYDKKGEWDHISYLCHKCYIKINNKKLGSNENIIKSMRQSRTGNLGRFTNHGKDIVGQWIAGKTLGLKDLNVEENNFHVPIDLSSHPIYGDSDVKTSSLIYGVWVIPIKDRGFDNVIILCMDALFENVERTYIIPRIEFCDEKRKQITIVKNPSKGIQWYNKYRVDEKQYNDTYHSAEIPRFFSPFDLWKGKYDKMR